MGPRLPGDRGPSARPDKPKSLTHNPFAALAAKVEAVRAETVAEQQPEAPAPEAVPVAALEAPPPAPPVEAASAPEPTASAEPAASTGGDPAP